MGSEWSGTERRLAYAQTARFEEDVDHYLHPCRPLPHDSAAGEDGSQGTTNQLLYDIALSMRQIVIELDDLRLHLAGASFAKRGTKQ